MRNFQEISILLVILFVLSLPSCGWMKRTKVKGAIDEAHRSVQSGDFQKAVDTYQSAHEKYPTDSETLKHYIETIESLKAQGDRAYDTQDFVQAEITYGLLLKNFPRFRNFANQLSFTEPFLATRIKQSRMVQAEKQAQSFLRTRDFQGGIDIYRTLTQQYPSDKAAVSRYVSLLESIKGQADLYFERKDFGSAGRAYRILLKNYPSLNSHKRFLSYGDGSLRAGIQACRKILFENGLKRYRSGDLTQAVSVWKEILTFDPENLEVKKATEKAMFQANHLKKVKSDEDK